jgi:hypothetical protein
MDYYKPAKGYLWWRKGKKWHIAKRGSYGIVSAYCCSASGVMSFPNDRDLCQKKKSESVVCRHCIKQQLHMRIERYWGV